MRALRTTAFASDLSPVTFVILDEDTTVSPDYAVSEDIMGGDDLGVFTISEAFDVDEGSDIAGASLIGAQRAAERYDDERNMAILYYFECQALANISEYGTLVATIPAPLSVGQVSYALKRLAAHPDYQHQTVVIPVEEDGVKLVRLADGSIAVEDMRAEGEDS